MTIMSEGRQSSVDDFGLSGYDEYEEASVSLTPFPKLKRDMRTLRRLRNPASAGDLTKRAVRRFRRFLYGYQENAIKVFDLRRPLPPCQKTTDLVLRRMTAEDLDHLDSIVSIHTLSIFRRRLPRSVGVLALVGEEPAGYGWMTQLPRWQEGRSGFRYPVIPKPGCAYFFDLLVHPSFRGRGLGALLIRQRMELAAKAGAETAFFIHDIQNRSLVEIAQQLGFQSGGRIRHRHVLWLRRDDMDALWQFALPGKGDRP